MVTIRHVQGEELLDTAFLLGGYAFGETPPFDTREEREKYLPYQVDKHFLILFEDGVPMASAANIHMTQAVRGKVFKLGGVASVATEPNARRKGYARRLVTQLFENMREHGEAVSGLYPFRESFYGRLGYVNFPKIRMMKFNPLHLGALLKTEMPGHVERHNIKDIWEELDAFVKRLQPTIHGMSLLPDSVSARLPEQGKQWVAVARVEGEIVGAMVYRLEGFHKSMKVRSFLYSSSAGKYLLLQWMARHGDQAAQVEMHAPPTDLLETWFYDLNVEVHSPADTITPMGRVSIVADLGGMQTGPGKFTASISDPQCPWNNGTWAFETVDGVLRVERASTTDCELTIQGLSALVFGVVDPADFAFWGWGDPAAETQAAMRTVFPAMKPYAFAGY